MYLLFILLITRVLWLIVEFNIFFSFLYLGLSNYFIFFLFYLLYVLIFPEIIFPSSDLCEKSFVPCASRSSMSVFLRRSNYPLSIKTIRLILLFHPARSTPPYLLKYLALHCTRVFSLPYLSHPFIFARRAFPPASLRLSIRSQRLPSVTLSDSLFPRLSVSVCHTSAIRFAVRERTGHNVPPLRSLLPYHRIY